MGKASALTRDPENTEQIRPEIVSAELKGPRKLRRIRSAIFDFEAELDPNRSQTKPKIPGTVPTDRRTTIPNDSYLDVGMFGRRSFLFFNCEIAHPGLTKNH